MNEEILSWSFSQDITELKLELGDTDHEDYANRDILYSSDGGIVWNQVTSGSDGLLTLMLSGSTGMLDFKAVGGNLVDHFYIRNADVTVIPVPAAVWLFASGLLGLAGVARRRAS